MSSSESESESESHHQEQEQVQKRDGDDEELHRRDVTMVFDVDPMAVKLGREIGKGAFSIVYMGEYRGQHVAVKCQPKDAEGDVPVFVRREVEMLRLLHHPRLLQFTGAADHVRAKQVWILSEYLNNGDADWLLKAIRSGTRSHIGWQAMVRIALDAAQGMEYLQQRHFVHRDIKSSNILLDDQYRAKLCDFGFAIEIKPVEVVAHGDVDVDVDAGKEHRKSYCGTDAYMAPEMFLNEDYDQSVDIFSFGVVLMEMSCCRVANSDGFLMRLPQYKFQVSLSEFRAALPASCPPALAALAAKCVSFEPSERPDIKTIVRTLEGVLQDTSNRPRDVVDLVPFTPDDREPQIEEDDDTHFGDGDDGESEGECEDEDEDDEEEDEETNEERGDDSSYKWQANGCPITRSMELDEDRSNVRLPVIGEQFLNGKGEECHKAVESTSRGSYHEGVMLKRSRRGKRSWVEKWFIIDQDQLRYMDIAPRRQQQHSLEGRFRTVQPTSSLSLCGCRIWKTTEMPELQFNVIDSNWKIKRELQALSRRDLDLWTELINQAIDHANDLHAREHDGANDSTTEASASSSSPSRPSRNRAHTLHLPTQGPSRRPSVTSDATVSQKIRRRSSAAKFEVPPELPETEEDRVDEVYVWLKQIGFQRYSRMLKAKGFDSLDFIREEPLARKSIRSAARKLRGDDDDD
uniref:TKL/LISK/LISK-DD1 protein kinase n=1 Tax=Hyaloperonospora arabidopsidis (strain Emoy2) TaxID=559515 RepID=M4BSU3_HYAAE